MQKYVHASIFESVKLQPLQGLVAYKTAYTKCILLGLITAAEQIG